MHTGFPGKPFPFMLINASTLISSPVAVWLISIIPYTCTNQAWMWLASSCMQPWIYSEMFPVSVLTLEMPGCILGMALAAVPAIGVFFLFRCIWTKQQSREIMQACNCRAGKSSSSLSSTSSSDEFFTYMRGQKALIKGLFSTNERP